MGEDALENAIGYRFKNQNLLTSALTHPSCSATENYERLEFLGDAVIELCVSRYLFEKYANAEEGELTKRRSSIVCSDSLMRAAKSINLGEYMKLGKGEAATGGRDKKSVLENAFEALMGAIYLDSDLNSVQPIVHKLLIANMEDSVNYAPTDNHFGGQDYKSNLQEKMQAKGNAQIVYDTYKTEGPPHNKVFYVRLYIDSREVSTGKGKSKKQAEQEAAKNALAIL